MHCLISFALLDESGNGPMAVDVNGKFERSLYDQVRRVSIMNQYREKENIGLYGKLTSLIPNRWSFAVVLWEIVTLGM